MSNKKPSLDLNEAELMQPSVQRIIEFCTARLDYLRVLNDDPKDGRKIRGQIVEIKLILKAVQPGLKNLAPTTRNTMGQ